MKAPLPQMLLVDGYNVIGAWADLKSLQQADFGSARDQLVSILSAYRPWAWTRIIVVFDGRSYGWEEADGVEVVFTGEHESADTMIEKLAAGLTSSYQVEVATSDFAEYVAAYGLGARVLSASALRERLAELDSFCRERLADRRSGRGIKLDDRLDSAVLETLDRLRRA